MEMHAWKSGITISTVLLIRTIKIVLLKGF